MYLSPPPQLEESWSAKKWQLLSADTFPQLTSLNARGSRSYMRLYAIFAGTGRGQWRQPCQLPQLWGRVDGATKPSARTEKFFMFSFRFFFW